MIALTTDIIPTTWARQQSDGGHQLRVRAVLYEDTKAREKEARDYTRRNGKPQTHTLIPPSEQLAGYPIVSRHVLRFGTLPSVTRSQSKIAPRIRRAHAMRRHGGELAFLRLSLTVLDSLPLRASSTVALARELVATFLDGWGCGVLAFDIALQRGEHGGTHVHLLLPLAFLSLELQQAALGAPAGEGGGVSLGPELHIVRVADTVKSRQKVATYMGREPDARLGLEDPSDPAYLAALEELLQHRASNDDSQLTWKRLPRDWRP